MAARISIKKNDTVVVIAGRDRGKSPARVLRVLPSKGRAIVEQVNVVKRHTKPNPQKGIKGGILDKEAPIAISNLAVFCKDCSKPTRVGHANGKRICIRCKTPLDK
jgi:large subunit ribosomal protein L24